MAKMHPEVIEKIHFAAESEAYVYEILREKLPDKMHVFYSVRWSKPDEHGLSLGEGDFIVLDPDFGFLVIEVKGGYKVEVNGSTWTLWSNHTQKRDLPKSPYDQANSTMWALEEKYRTKYHESLRATFGFAVMFPYFNLPSDLACDAIEDNTIMLNDMKNVRNKINSIFHSWKRNETAWLSNETFNNLINLFEGESFEKLSVYSICMLNKRDLTVTNNIQSACIDLLTNYPQALIVGSAGTGKTFMAIEKAKQFSAHNKSTAYVCFNRLVSQYAAKQLEEYNVDCYTFHALMCHLIGQDAFEQMIADDYDLPHIVEELVKHRTIKYDSIVIDEAQDLRENWALALRSLLKTDEGNLYVFYDEEQNIFNRNFGEAFFISNPPYLLRRNLRNTKTIWEWLSYKTGLGQQAIANGVEGLQPSIYVAKTKALAITQIQKNISTNIKEGISSSSIVILSDKKKENSILSDIDKLGDTKIIEKNDLSELKENQVGFYTIQSYKGLESDAVICLISKDITNELQYVAYSRAKCLLYIIQY